MRYILTILISLLVTACCDDSASFYINGSNHTLTLLREQKYFWKDQATLSLIVARLPECQRRHTLTLAPASTVNIDVFTNGDGTWTLRSDKAIWEAGTQTCTLIQATPKAELGERVGTFKVQKGKLVFEPAGANGAVSAFRP